MQGGEDDLVPPENADFPQKMLTHATTVNIVRIPEMNHFLPWTRYAQVKAVERLSPHDAALTSSPIFKRSASKDTTGYIGSSGRACQAPTSAITASVTELMNSGDHSVPYGPASKP
jgi:hypothetical protein